MSGTYTIKLTQFEGPFDLLLFFIERDELDIHDIPIAKITDDFLAYIREMESINVDLASEFILVAATLMRIKAKLLIPRKPVDEDGNEIDPREELVQRLLEYKRYKSVLDELRDLEASRALRNHRGNVARDLKVIANKALVDVELESLTLFKLMRAFENVMSRMEDRKKKTVHRVFRYEHTIQGQQVFILSKIRRGEKRDFKSIFGACQTRMHAIITFLAMLELINLERLHCLPGEGINSLWLSIPEEDTRPDVDYPGEGDDEDRIPSPRGTAEEE
ncbi:MAG: segregation/condensation protein A [Bacteroidota bacterium]